MSEDYSESKAYLEIFKRNKAIYEATPPRKFIARARLRKRVRYAYGDAVGSGNHVAMPNTAWDAALDFLNDWWNNWLGKTLLVVGVIAAVVGMIWWATTWDGTPPKPLPKGIQQHGYTFIIPPNWVARANYEDANAFGLCERLPDWRSRYGEFESRSRGDGSIVITCVVDD